MGHGSQLLKISAPERSKVFRCAQAARMATTSACAVGSLLAVTRLKPSPTTRPSFTMTAPKGPPLRCTFSRES